MVSLLQHERGREWTFEGRWPFKAPHPHCLAFAGFHYVGEDDVVQCIYCGGVVRKWRPGNEDPTEVHVRLYPDCPLMTRKPIQNIGSTSAYRCCRFHPESLSLKNQRLRMTHNPMQSHSYLITLLTLLVSIGTMPYGYAAVSVGDTVSLARQPTADGEMQAIQTWNGLVGIKSKDFIVPEHFSPYTWILDLTPCQSLQTAIKEVAEKIVNVTGLENINWQEDFESKVRDLSTRVKNKLTELGLITIWESLEATTETVPARTGCALEFSEILGPKLCARIAEETATTLSGLLGTLSDPEAAMAAIGMLTKINDNFLEGVRKLRHLLDDLRYGKVPSSVNEFMKTDCQVLLSMCPTNIQAKANLDYSKLIKVVDLKKYTGNGAGKLKVDLMTPCIQEDAVVTEYELTTFPLKKDGEMVKLIPKVEKIWTQSKSEAKILINEPELCEDIQPNVYACPPQSLVPAAGAVEGTRDFIKISGEERNSEKVIEVVDLVGNQILIGTGTPLDLQYQCQGQKSEKRPVNGIAAMKLGERCFLRSDVFNLEQSGTAVETVLKQSFADNPFKTIPNLMTFTRGLLKEAKIDWLELMLTNIESHFQAHANVYVGVSAAGICLLGVIYLLKFLFTHKHYIPCYVPPQLIVQQR